MHSYVFDFYSHYYTAQLQFFVIFLYFIWKRSAMVHYPTLQGAPLRMTNFYLENRYSNLSFFMSHPVVYATLTSVWYKTGCIQMSFYYVKILPGSYLPDMFQPLMRPFKWGTHELLSQGVSETLVLKLLAIPVYLKDFQRI